MIYIYIYIYIYTYIYICCRKYNNNEYILYSRSTLVFNNYTFNNYNYNICILYTCTYIYIYAIDFKIINKYTTVKILLIHIVRRHIYTCIYCIIIIIIIIILQ